MVCILFVLQLQRYKIFLDFCYILQSFLYSILHFITLLQRVGNFSYITNCDVMKEATDVYEYQLQAGKWADDYLSAASSDNFDAMSYLGEYFNTSVWLEPLTEIDVIKAERELENLKTK